MYSTAGLVDQGIRIYPRIGNQFLPMPMDLSIPYYGTPRKHPSLDHMDYRVLRNVDGIHVICATKSFGDRYDHCYFEKECQTTF